MHVVQTRWRRSLGESSLPLQGFPDLATRVLLKRMHTDLRVPILGLVDYDPFGLALFLTYAAGSARMSFEAHLHTVPIQLLGMKCDLHGPSASIFPLPNTVADRRAKDLESIPLPAESIQELTETDRRKLCGLRGDEYVKAHPELMDEVVAMEEGGAKVELEALYAYGLEFIAAEFLPHKLAECGVLDAPRHTSTATDLPGRAGVLGRPART